MENLERIFDPIAQACIFPLQKDYKEEGGIEYSYQDSIRGIHFGFKNIRGPGFFFKVFRAKTNLNTEKTFFSSEPISEELLQIAGFHKDYGEIAEDQSAIASIPNGLDRLPRTDSILGQTRSPF